MKKIIAIIILTVLMLTTITNVPAVQINNDSNEIIDTNVNDPLVEVRLAAIGSIIGICPNCCPSVQVYPVGISYYGYHNIRMKVEFEIPKHLS